ncbi:Crp/Fnr family transcriptional regulator [uncultured Flavobacterium sp.]|uniref:Crp/Fnr family transcriptional regulator n=1 Tax=uncultured Flavobacterium sp. TaxID=165435 RepID=UPI0025D2DD7E|nr:Crp/Fnr family transcriptional regulator [uncultured Flavobacterium sp.]
MKDTLKAFLNHFAPLSDRETNEVASLFRPVMIRRLDHLYKEGDNIKSLYYIHSGVMRGYYPKNGTEHTSSFYFGPTMMTDLPTIRDNTPTQMNMQALKDTECYEADFNAVEQLAFSNPSLLRVFYSMFEHLLNELINRQVSFIYDTPRERYINLFKERPHIIAEIPQHYIASYLGIQPETLSRIRKKIV